MPKVSFRTLGCRLNQAETDQLAEDLLGLGFEVVPESDGPDVLVINTCTVTKEATRSSRRLAARATGENPGAAVVLTGCYAVAEHEEAASIPGIALLASNDEKEQLAGTIVRHLGISPGRLSSVDRQGFQAADRSRVNMKVQTGCDEFCSFCIIPLTRGPLKSLPIADLLHDARKKVDAGARELVLAGVHLGKYGWDVGRPDDALMELLHGLLAIDGLARIRLSSILCRHLTPRLIQLIRDESRICRFLHVPLQSGDNEVLERMNRPYMVEEFFEHVDAARESVPGLALSTDVIVGFPGETASQFEATIDAVRRAAFMKVHAFRYSPRPGTPSASWDGQVPEQEKKIRSKHLISVANELRLAFNASQIGLQREVLVEEAADGRLSGHTDNFVRVRFEGPALLKDRLATVQISEPGLESVKGELIGEVPWQQADPRSELPRDLPLLSLVTDGH